MNETKNFNPNMIFLKLGGSLITDKGKPHTSREDVINRLCVEIKSVLDNNNHLDLIIGHGSGSFGHVPAKRFRTHHGVISSEEWHGFFEVWFQARKLNQIIIESLNSAGIHAISFPVSSSTIASNKQIINWNINPIRSALNHKILPIVYGDVIFDTSIGGTIVSTEDIFSYLTRELKPKRILLAGKDEGVFADYPRCDQLIPAIKTTQWNELIGVLNNAKDTDVTGGMRSKVQSMINLVDELPGLQVNIFSGIKPGNISAIIEGKQIGTLIH